MISGIFSGASYAGAQPGDFIPLADLIISGANAVNDPIVVDNSNLSSACSNRISFEKRQARKIAREALEILNSKSHAIPASGWSPYPCIIFSAMLDLSGPSNLIEYEI